MSRLTTYALHLDYFDANIIILQSFFCRRHLYNRSIVSRCFNSRYPARIPLSMSGVCAETRARNILPQTVSYTYQQQGLFHRNAVYSLWRVLVRHPTSTEVVLLGYK